MVIVKTFDELVLEMNTAMVVVTTAADGERSGCLVGFHSQCSIDPPLYVVWLSVLNHTSRLAATAQYVAVHLPCEDDFDVAELFGGTTGDAVDKFAATPWEPGPGGVPLLARCPNRFVLERVSTLDAGGDHVCVIGRPHTADRGGSVFAPLRYSSAREIHPGHPPDEPATEGKDDHDR